MEDKASDVMPSRPAQLPIPTRVYRSDDVNPALVYLARLAPSGRRSMARALRTIATLLASGPDPLEGAGPEQDPAAFPWHLMRHQHTQAVRAYLAERYAVATANRHLSALRGVLEEAWRLGHMTAEDHARAADVKSVRGEGRPAAAGRALGAGELRALFEACARDEGPAGRRDAAILAVLYVGGLRRSELVALTVADVRFEGEGVATLSVGGKGRRDRLAYVTNGAARYLGGWVDVRGPEAGALFVAIDKAGAIDPELGHLTDRAVPYILDRRAEEAGVERFTPHDLRRTFIGDLLDAGEDIVTVQKLAGHANVTTTARYDRRPERRKREAASKLHVPYVG